MQDYRLDCLKLAHALDLPTETVVARAKAYYDFVVGIVSVKVDAQPLSPKVFDRETRGTPRDPKTPQEAK